MILKDIKISVIAPVFNEEKVVDEFYRRTKKMLEKLSALHEIIFIDDGSADSTLARIKKLRQADENVKIVCFSRNFGHAAAISAGLDHASGDAVMVIDADLQDPPEVLEKFINKWREGYEVVYGIRRKRKEWFGKRFCYWLFYRMMRASSTLKMPLDAGDFSLMDKKVVEVIKNMPERNRFVRGLRSWAGYKQIGIEYDRQERFAGETKYPFKKLLRLAADGIFSFSYVPLRLVTLFGFLVAALAFVAVFFLLYERYIVGNVGVPGIPATLVAVLFLGGIQLISIGVLGEYIARVYEETKQRPHYIVKEKDGL